jgi:hypothetical protein
MARDNDEHPVWALICTWGVHHISFINNKHLCLVARESNEIDIIAKFEEHVKHNTHNHSAYIHMIPASSHPSLETLDSWVDTGTHGYNLWDLNMINEILEIPNMFRLPPERKVLVNE